MAAWQRTSAALNVTELRPLPRLVDSPGEWSELAVEETDADRPWVGERVVSIFDRQNSVLKRAVVELHHVRSVNPFAAKTAREVYVDDVEPPGTERQIRGLRVNDHAVTDLAATKQSGVGGCRPHAAARNVNEQLLLGCERAGLGYRSLTKDEH
jgi:hypothetical protein